MFGKINSSNPYDGINYVPLSDEFSATISVGKGRYRVVGYYKTLDAAIQARRAAIEGDAANEA